MQKILKFWYLLLIFSIFILYSFLLNGWWFGDDPEIVVFVSKHRPFEYFINPSIWQSFSPFNLTPWILLSLEPDFLMFRFKPLGYYIHHLISLVFVVISLFIVLDMFVKKRIFVILGVLIFLLSPATFTVCTWLSTRHYLEGMGFSLLSVYFFVKGIRDNKYSFILFSYLFYIPAILSKEVYVPLPFFLLLIPEKTFRVRFIRIIPFLMLSFVYFLYRMTMLGDDPIGGYSSIWPWSLSSALSDSRKIFELYSGSWWIFLVVLITIILGIHFYKDRKTKAREISRYILIFLIFFVTILPVSSILNDDESLRYIFIISTFITSLFILSIDRIFDKGSRVFKIFAGMALLVVLAGFFQTYLEKRKQWNMKRSQARVEGNFFMENFADLNAIFKINQPHWFYDGLEKMEEEEANKEIQRKILLVVEEFYGFDTGKEGLEKLRIFAYDPDSKKVIDISEKARKDHEEFLKTVKDKPFSVTINIKNNTMELQLGPYDGQYLLLEASPSQPDFYYMAFPINKNFGIKLTHRERMRIFRFAYKSPEGWITVSPAFLIDRSKDQMIKWGRD